MSECPFDIKIIPSRDPERIECLRCLSLLRSIDGVREVYDAIWNGEPVIVKLFLSPLRARRHVQREWRGLQQLQVRGLSGPKPLYVGRTEAGHQVLVTEKIEDSSAVSDLLLEKPEHIMWAKVVSMVIQEVARQNRRGVVQEDMHFGNFLVRNEQVFALDPAQMKFSSKPIGQAKSLRLLVKLLVGLPIAHLELVWPFVLEYAQLRSWTLSHSDKERFGQRIYREKAKCIKNYLKKIYRNSKYFFRCKRENGSGMIRKDFCSGNEYDNFIQHIDKLMDDGQILKNGNTCYVCRVRWHDKNLVIKRYNHKGIFHSLRHTLRRSRAWRNWMNGYRLFLLDIPTALPVVFFEQKKHGLVWQSYIVNEFIEGPKLNEILSDPNLSEKDKHEVVKRAIELLDKLEKHRITHGDLKHTNIIISPEGVHLIDLDSLMHHRIKWYFKIKKAKDRKRFKAFDI